LRGNCLKQLLSLLLVLGCIAAVRADVKDVMDRLMAQVFILTPFIVSETSFNDPANAAKISDALQEMVALSRQVSHEERISKTGFQVPATLLTEQLEDVENVFRNGSKDYALANLRSTLGVCMSCHTQLPAVSTHFSTLNESRVLVNPFEEAEFLFLIRNFDAAMTLYAELIQGYPLNQAKPDDLEKAVYRQAFYYVRVARDLPGLSIVLQRNSANQQLPQRLQNQIKGLIAAVDAAKDDKYPQFTDAQGAELRSYAETTLSEKLRGDFSLDSPENMIAALSFSSVLYQYLDAYPTTPLKPEILYWLSFSERRYPHQSLYVLPDLYLKQCVLDYPQSPVAKQCLAEYEDSVTLGFTGSSGTHIPDDVTQELNTMRQLVGAP